MKEIFQKVATAENLHLTYARKDASNVLLDAVEYSQLDDNGLAMLVTPLYGIHSIDKFGRMRRRFEVGIFGMCDLDSDDADNDVIIRNAHRKLMKVLRRINAVPTTIFQSFIERFDLNIAGVFVNIELKSTEGVCDE